MFFNAASQWLASLARTSYQDNDYALDPLPLEDDPNKARTSQLAAEVLFQPAAFGRVSQLPVEVVHTGDPEARFSQVPVEVVQRVLRETAIVIIID